MEGKEAIIAKILADAKAKSDENERVAKEYAANVKKSADAWAKEYSNAMEIKLKSEAEEIVTRKKIVADLDVKKHILKAKQDALGVAFLRAEEKLCSMDKNAYLKFVLSLIEANADEGDEVILSCDGVLTENDIIENDISKAKSLSVKKELGNFKGGVILVGKTCDKNLTFHEIVSIEKEKNISVYAKKIFC